MTPEKFDWNSPEGEREIARRGEQRIAHEKQAAQELASKIGDGIEEDNFFEGITPPMPDVYGLETPLSDRMASGPMMVQTPVMEFPIAQATSVIQGSPNSAYAPSVIINSLNQ